MESRTRTRAHGVNAVHYIVPVLYALTCNVIVHRLCLRLNGIAFQASKARGAVQKASWVLYINEEGMREHSRSRSCVSSV